MRKVRLCYRVPVEKQGEYLKFISEELKPKFETNGCRSYSLFREVDLKSEADLVATEELVTELIFDDAEAMNRFRSQFKDEPWKSLLARYHSYQIPGTDNHFIKAI